MRLPRFSGIFIIALFILGIVVFNNWITREINKFTLIEKERKTPKAVSVNAKEPVVLNKSNLKGAVRKTRLDPSRKYSINFIYVDNQEVARFKSTKDGIYDLKGEIPNGEIKFTDESRETYGTEQFYENARHGLFKEYYANGNIRQNAKYTSGKIKWNKEYYIDGTLRMEENYQDALLKSESKEVGEGKVYYRDGKLMYEWNITNMNHGGFNRSYDKDGRMVAENIYNEEGRLVKKRRYDPNGLPDQ